MPDPNSELDKIFKAITKKAKNFSVHRGSEHEDVYRIPFLSPNLNYATEGGAAIGRFNLMWGPESSFKSRVLYELIAQAQDLYAASETALYPRILLYRETGDEARAKRLTEELEYIQATWPEGMECSYYNVEQQYDPVWAAKLGIDTDRLHIIESQTVEDIVGVMQATYKHVHLHAVDSTSSASTVEEQGMKMTDRRMGLDARVWKSTLRRTMKDFDTNKNIGLLINQASTNMRTGGATPVSTKFIGHTSSMTLKFERGRFLYLKDGVLVEDKPTGADEDSFAGRAEADGVQIFATVQKSRVCRPFRIAALHARFGAKHFDHLWETINAGLHLKIINQSGTWFSIDGEDGSYHGMAKLRERVEPDQPLQDKIYAMLMDSLIEPEDR